MTNLPEAKLAREAEIALATMAMITDYDCWKVGEEPVSAHAVGGHLTANAALTLDMERVFAAAKLSGIALEINANPRRLDLDAPYVRRAIELGIPISINTDAHSADHMDLLPYGITQARRGWAEAKNVINTWDYETFIAWVQKRGK